MAYQQELAQAIVSRRIELAIGTARELARKAGLSERIIGDIENSRRSSYSSSTLAKLDKTLDWTPGSAQKLLNYGTPPQDARHHYPTASQATSHKTGRTDPHNPTDERTIILESELFLGLTDAERQEVQSAAESTAFQRAREIRESKARLGTARFPLYLPTSNDDNDDAEKIPAGYEDEAFEKVRLAQQNNYGLAANPPQPNPHAGTGEENQDPQGKPE